MTTEKPTIYRNYSVLILLAVIGGLVYLYFHKESGHTQQLIEKDKAYQLQLDSLDNVWSDSLHHQELKALEVFQEYVKKLDRMEGEKNHWVSKYNHEKNNNRAFTDADVDSLLQSVR